MLITPHDLCINSIFTVDKQVIMLWITGKVNKINGLDVY